MAEAIGDIRSGELDKVVLARVFTRGPIGTRRVQALAERFPTCTTFAFGVGGRAFIGASPERLVTLDGRGVSPSRSPVRPAPVATRRPMLNSLRRCWPRRRSA